MKSMAASLKCVLVMAGFLLVLWLPLVAYVHSPERAARDAQAESGWIGRAERLRLMRYHGTQGLKITHDGVYIWRDSKWVQVRRRGEGAG